MSTGYLVSEAAWLHRLARSTTRFCQNACGERDELTRELQSISSVLMRLQDEETRAYYAVYKGKIAKLLPKCEKVLRILQKVLRKYSALSEEERNVRKLWRRIRFGNGQIQELAELREKLVYYHSAISLSLQMTTANLAGIPVQQTRKAGDSLLDIKAASSISDTRSVRFDAWGQKIDREPKANPEEPTVPFSTDGGSVVHSHTDSDPWDNAFGRTELLWVRNDDYDYTSDSDFLQNPDNDLGQAGDSWGSSELSSSDNDGLSRDSVFSAAAVGTSLSFPSIHYPDELLPAAEELVVLFAEDFVLKGLYKAAIEDETIGAERFDRSFRRLLVIYSKELQDEAHEALQKSAVQLVRQSTSYISNSIRSRYDPDSNRLDEGIKRLVSQLSERARQDRVEQYLGQLKSKGTVQQSVDMADVVDIDEEELGLDEGPNEMDLPNLTNVKAFLVSGSPFQNLRENLQRFVQPISVAHELSRLHPQEEAAQTVPSTTAYPSHLRSVLSLYSSKIWSTKLWAWARYWEPPLDESKTRIRWTCQCGTRLWDDFKESHPGAAERLCKSLDVHTRNTVGRPQRSANEAHQPSNPQIPPAAHLRADNSGLTAAASASRAPLGSASRKSRTLATTANGTTNTAPLPGSPHPCEKKFLLLCLSKRNDTLRLVQLSVEHITSDFSLFRMLQNTYRDHRGPLARYFSPRKLSSINFRKFERHPRDRVVILSGAYPLPNRVNPEACHQDHAIPKCDTVYDLHPTPPDLEPYIGPNGLAHLLQHPHEAEEEGNNLPPQNVWLKRFPKKEKTKLTACPPYQFGLGWGIEFEEGWHINRFIRVTILLLVLGATIFLICWWKFHHDVQSASGMAALLLTYATLIISMFAATAMGG